MRGTLNINTEQWLNGTGRGNNRSTRRETCPSATSTTTNSTWTAVGSVSLFSTASRAALGLDYSPSHWVRAAPSRGAHRGRDVELPSHLHLLPTSGMRAAIQQIRWHLGVVLAVRQICHPVQLNIHNIDKFQMEVVDFNRACVLYPVPSSFKQIT